MDLGISGRTALVCASSRGLGRGCARALAREGARVVINGRDPEQLERTAGELRESTGAEIIAVAADVGTVDGRKALLNAAGDVDILINNNGGPPPADFRELTHDEMMAGVEANMLTPIALIQTVIDGMIERRFGRIVNITSITVKAPLPGLDLSSGARIGLTGFLAGVARQVAAHNVTINHLLPGSIDTDRIAALTARLAADKGTTPEQELHAREQDIAARRLGTTEEFGAACAFLCSAQASYITGQSLLIDGGAYPGVL